MMENYGFGRRNGAIDMLRGLTMFLMIFVNDLWTVGDVPHWLEHAGTHEDAMGLADIVFPLRPKRPSATSFPGLSPCW